MQWFDNLNKVMESLKPGAFLSAEFKGEKNTMTIGWGYAGIMWGKPYFMVLVRPSRHTHDMIKESGTFTVSVPKAGDLSEELMICGTKSGRDINKSEVVTFVDGKNVNAPVVDGCELYFECKVDYVHELIKERMPKDVVDNIYGDHCFHTMFFGLITDYYEK